MFRFIRRLLRRYAQRVRAVYAVLSLVAAQEIDPPRPFVREWTTVRDDSILKAAV